MAVPKIRTSCTKYEDSRKFFLMVHCCISKLMALYTSLDFLELHLLSSQNEIDAVGSKVSEIVHQL